MHDPGADLDQLLAQRRQRSMLDLLRQGEGAHEVGEVVGQRVELEAHRVMPEGIDPAIEGGPQRRLFGFTRRVLHDRIPSPASSQRFIIKIGRWRHQRSSHLGNPSETIAADRVVTGPRLDRGDPQVNRLLQ
jgi:hypothetical protein